MIPSIVFFPVVGQPFFFEHILDCADNYIYTDYADNVYTDCADDVSTWTKKGMDVWEIMDLIQGFSKLDVDNADSWRLISVGFMHARIENQD